MTPPIPTSDALAPDALAPDALTPDALAPDALRAQTLGIDALVETPFGERLLVYADYTASGRHLAFVEDYLRSLAPLYANSHTEDSLTGRTATHLLHEAEAAIKRCVGAGPGGKVVCVGAGSTGAIHKLQEFLGVAVPPATARVLAETARAAAGTDRFEALLAELRARRPVVFVGPYEHHSNEVTWREGLCETVEVDLCPNTGGVDLAHLERLLADARYAGRTRVGSFSAASNVTGLVAPVRAIARMLHRQGALALFDYAAGGPYLPIVMDPPGDPEGALDAVFLSPHKFLGGPGAAGVLVFHERLYPRELPPSVGGGGTVDYVGPEGHDFTADIEAREKAGTPGFYQTLRAALALLVKEAVGADAIHAREHAHLTRALARWAAEPRLDVLGPRRAEGRLGIVSFNVADGQGGTLHPKFVTVLLNDLFGIQSRAGCSCAGPYGHRLLGIGADTSERYRAAIRKGRHGIKPGWCRVGFHFTMDDAEAAFVAEAVAFVARRGACFLPLYAFDVASGAWTHREAVPPRRAFSLAAALGAPPPAPPAPQPPEARRARYASALAEAERLAETLGEPATLRRLADEDVPDVFFAVA
ncbi:MAG: aminotransferase class V-fold PLP-dependent enzyme [Rubricoccaceae bacterium]